MSTEEQILGEIRAIYARLKQAETRARHAYDHYLDDLNAAYAQSLRRVEAEFWQASGEASPAAPDSQDRTEEVSPLRWILAGWDYPAWATFAPSTEAPIPSWRSPGPTRPPRRGQPASAAIACATDRPRRAFRHGR